MYWFWYITITCKVLDKNPERWLCYVLKHIDSLFDKEIDDVILNAFVVFLSFEGIRSSYKRIQLSAISFFQKILSLLDS